MTEYEVDPYIWFSDREVDYPPIHFVTASTLLTINAKQWVLDNLRGRYSITMNNTNFLFDDNSIGVISFEDPREAMLYELKWS